MVRARLSCAGHVAGGHCFKGGLHTDCFFPMPWGKLSHRVMDVTHSASSWQDQDGSRVSMQAWAEAPRRASWCWMAGLFLPLLASYSPLAHFMTEPGCANLAASCYQECPAHWPDLTGSLSLPPDGDKTQRWSEGGSRSDTLHKVTVGDVKLGLDPDAQVWSPCGLHGQSPGMCCGLRSSREVPGTHQRMPHMPSPVLAVPPWRHPHQLPCAALGYTKPPLSRR